MNASTQNKNTTTVMSKNKTTIATNNNNNNNMLGSTNNNMNNSKGQSNIPQATTSNLGKIGLDSIMGQKLVGPKISTVKR